MESTTSGRLQSWCWNPALTSDVPSVGIVLDSGRLRPSTEEEFEKSQISCSVYGSLERLRKGQRGSFSGKSRMPLAQGPRENTLVPRA